MLCIIARIVVQVSSGNCGLSVVVAWPPAFSIFSVSPFHRFEDWIAQDHAANYLKASGTRCVDYGAMAHRGAIGDDAAASFFLFLIQEFFEFSEFSFFVLSAWIAARSPSAMAAASWTVSSGSARPLSTEARKKSETQ